MRISRPVHKRARRTKENSISNGTKDEEDPEVTVVESSNSDSQPKLSNPESEDDEAEELKTSDISNQTSKNAAAEDDEEEGEAEEREREELKRENHRKNKKNTAAEEKENGMHKFPMNRINRIVRSAASEDLRLTHEAVFLINKASEKFLDLFCEEAYACSVQDHKNYVAYKNLYFIPEKIKIEDALEERKSAGT